MRRNTGKSTFLHAINSVLGTGAIGYSITADFDAFLQSERSSGHKEHIARLAGRRMVVSIEVDEGQRMAEALIKHLTGGENVTASFKFGNTFEFFPAFQLWLAADHRPRVRADDNAMWRRILQLPFEVMIPEQIPSWNSSATSAAACGELSRSGRYRHNDGLWP